MYCREGTQEIIVRSTEMRSTVAIAKVSMRENQNI